MSGRIAETGVEAPFAQMGREVPPLRRSWRVLGWGRGRRVLARALRAVLHQRLHVCGQGPVDLQHAVLLDATQLAELGPGRSDEALQLQRRRGPSLGAVRGLGLLGEEHHAARAVGPQLAAVDVVVEGRDVRGLQLAPARGEVAGDNHGHCQELPVDQAVGAGALVVHTQLERRVGKQADRESREGAEQRQVGLRPPAGKATLALLPLRTLQVLAQDAPEDRLQGGLQFGIVDALRPTPGGQRAVVVAGFHGGAAVIAQSGAAVVAGLHGVLGHVLLHNLLHKLRCRPCRQEGQLPPVGGAKDLACGQRLVDGEAVG
mmetsp:Transcript_88685/g.159902  ORF Transcript_88685/g.159902 Transcript_88685/m.159902 type:complete len:317 (-) Transcript_88685:224-1174(-)